ncbi:ParB/RepB/Spo0J family partition protein [uncultured Pseudacidovorax sp.]|uniref:ParB/RepB/Spo0J family partition protein n=1 Tax=uncultured Pseudacidovorax sp. TaxID=679313 RepID=UPI0025D2BDE4|nr:ParB/RepB/Spo0J family partition protein [uncultured Pseudacidovorax sp.]
MSKKLAAKASLIQLPPVRPATVAESSPSPVTSAPAETATAPAVSVASTAAPALPEARPKTAPGSMAVFMASQSAAVKEAEELRLKLRAFDGAVPMKALDPRRIRPSRWANRHADALADKAYEELRADIAASGTNVQPICVRALAAGTDPNADYELVFGHRRHRACLELGLPVQAIIADIDDKGLFEAMERENRARKNLSAWEQGMMYRRALDSGLYASQRKLAESVGVDLSLISKSLALARLPDSVIEAFPSPLDVQFRWAQPLSEVLQRDPEGLVARAKELRAAKAVLSAKQVLEVLLGQSQKPLNRSTPVPERRIGRAGQGAVLTGEADGRVTLRFDAGVLTEARQAALLAWLQGHLDSE